MAKRNHREGGPDRHNRTDQHRKLTPEQQREADRLAERSRDKGEGWAAGDQSDRRRGAGRNGDSSR